MKYTCYKLTLCLTLVGVTALYAQEIPIPLSTLDLTVTDAANNILRTDKTTPEIEYQACLARLETATPTTHNTTTLKVAKKKTVSTDEEETEEDECSTSNAEDDEETEKPEDDSDAAETDPHEQARQAEILRLAKESERIEAQKDKLASENDLLEQLIRREQLKDGLKQVARTKYLTDPFVEGTLFISDRRIELNGDIDSDTADSVTRSIHVYNNEDSTYPIFLVISHSAGGTATAGAHIIAVMQHSQAPVYVVVKRYAASMAAIITTLATRSFAYPDALISHHQIARIFLFDIMNLSQIDDETQLMKEWSKRLLGVVAKKMNITLEEFVKKMYEHNSDGVWTEFAADARKLKWVDFVVSDIRETSFISKVEEFKNKETPLSIITEEGQAKVGKNRGQLQNKQ